MRDWQVYFKKYSKHLSFSLIYQMTGLGLLTFKVLPSKLQKPLDLQCLRSLDNIPFPFTEVEIEAPQGFEVQVCKMVTKM